MEAIGQKVTFNSTDEIIITDELGVDSVKMGEEKIFDETLDEILAEHPLKESQLEELLDGEFLDGEFLDGEFLDGEFLDGEFLGGEFLDGESLDGEFPDRKLLDGENLTASLASSLLTQNQEDPEIVRNDFSTAELLNIPTKVLDDNLWTEDTNTDRALVLKKSAPLTQELIEVLDPRVPSEKTTFQNLPVQGVAETGLQSILLESDLENPESLLQTVFHQAKPPEEGSEFTEDDSQAVLQKNRNLPVQLEEDSEFSMLQKVFHQVKPPRQDAESSEDELQTVLQTNTSQPVPIKENNLVEQNLKSEQENLEGLVQKEIQTVLHQELQVNEQEVAKPVAGPILGMIPAEVPFAEEEISTMQSPQIIEKTKTEKSLLDSDIFNETEEFESKVNSKMRTGLQMTDVENLNDSAEKVSILPTEKLKAVESLKVVDDIKTSEALQANAKEVLKGEVKEKTTAGHQMIDVENSSDSTQKVSLLPTEKLKATESLKVVDGIKTSEALQVKATEVLESRVQEKAHAGLRIIDVENMSDRAEKVSILPTEKLKATESLKVADNIKTKETFQAKPAEVPEGGVKGKTTAVFQVNGVEENSKDFSENSSKQSLNQLNGVENSKDISEKLSKQPLNQFRSISSEETQLSSNAKSFIELAPSLGINTVSEIPGTASLRVTEVANSPNQNLRSADLPFNMEQVVSRVRILSGNGIEEMTLRLHPEELGQMSLKIRQSGGNLSIDMRVDNMLAKQIVESGFDSLRSRFLDQELSYQDLALNVDINERDSKYGGNRKFTEFDEEMFSSERGNKEEISELEETPLVRHRTDSGLNLYV